MERPDGHLHPSVGARRSLTPHTHRDPLCAGQWSMHGVQQGTGSYSPSPQGGKGSGEGEQRSAMTSRWRPCRGRGLGSAG